MSDNTLMDDDDSVNNLFQNYNEVLTQENLKREVSIKPTLSLIFYSQRLHVNEV